MDRRDKIRILIIEKVDASFHRPFPTHQFEVDHRYGLKPDQVKAILPGYDALIVRSGYRVNHELLEFADNLKLVGRLGSGMENIDQEYCIRRSIACINSPEGNRDAVAEHTLGLILGFSKKIVSADRQVHLHQWDRSKNRGFELSGKTIGIIGFGNTGGAFAQLLQGFNIKVLAYDKYKTGFGTPRIVESSLEQIYQEADILSLHIPYNEETHNWFSMPRMEKFRKPILLINTSRGSIVHTKDLITGLEKGMVIGAGLDVLEYEESNFQSLSLFDDTTFKKLLSFDEVIVTPHIAGLTTESNIKLAEILANKVFSFFKVYF